jgi:hypothetical protein
MSLSPSFHYPGSSSTSRTAACSGGIAEHWPSRRRTPTIIVSAVPRRIRWLYERQSARRRSTLGASIAAAGLAYAALLLAWASLGRSVFTDIGGIALAVWAAVPFLLLGAYVEKDGLQRPHQVAVALAVAGTAAEALVLRHGGVDTVLLIATHPLLILSVGGVAVAPGWFRQRYS